MLFLKSLVTNAVVTTRVLCIQHFRRVLNRNDDGSHCIYVVSNYKVGIKNSNKNFGHDFFFLAFSERIYDVIDGS